MYNKFFCRHPEQHGADSSRITLDVRDFLVHDSLEVTYLKRCGRVVEQSFRVSDVWRKELYNQKECCFPES